MSISAKDVNELRKATGSGMMDCKKALTESNGDMDAAIDWLRKKGQKISDKRADRDAKEGVVIAKTTSDGKSGVIVNLSCETDFVANSDDFVNFAQSIADLAATDRLGSKEDVLNAELNGTTIKEGVLNLVGKIGEKIEIANYEKVDAEFVVSYIHAGYKIGVLIPFNKAIDEGIGKDIAMQVAAMRPIATDEDGVPAEVIAKEMEIGKEQAMNEGKPENIIEKIAQGKVKKFLKENTLLNQQFVKDGSKTIREYLKGVDNELQVLGFKRVATGDN